MDLDDSIAALDDRNLRLLREAYPGWTIAWTLDGPLVAMLGDWCVYGKDVTELRERLESWAKLLAGGEVAGEQGQGVDAGHDGTVGSGDDAA